MLLLVRAVAPAANAARAGYGRAAVALLSEVVAVVDTVVWLVANLQVADELLGLTRVLERVTALAEFLRRRVYALLGVRDGAGVLTRGLTGGTAFGLALFRPLTVPGHGGLAGLAVRGVAAAPLAVLAQLNTVRRVPLGLVGLVVAALAVLTCERDRDSYVSTSHAPDESSAGLMLIVEE